MIKITYTQEYRDKNKTNSVIVDGTRYEINSDNELLIFANDGPVVRKFEYDEWLSVSPIF